MATFRDFLHVSRLGLSDRTSGKRIREMLHVMRENSAFTGKLTPERAVRILQQLGPTYVKIGQIASNRADVLPKEYCDAFEKLRFVRNVIPALIKKFIDAKESGSDRVEVWGTGAASREFLYVDDAARGIVRAAESYDKPDPVNLGAGMEITIRDLVDLISELTGFEGEIVWDVSKPDGQPRRMLDVSVAEREFGFRATVEFREGLKKTIEWYVTQK